MFVFLTGGGFQQGNITGYVTSPDIDEASGCAMSRKHPGVLYTLNDHAPHGHENKVYVLHINGTLLATYDIHDADNEDWEDIAIGPCDNSDTTVDCLYIGKWASSREKCI